MICRETPEYFISGYQEEEPRMHTNTLADSCPFVCMRGWLTRFQELLDGGVESLLDLGDAVARVGDLGLGAAELRGQLRFARGALLLLGSGILEIEIETAKMPSSSVCFAARHFRASSAPLPNSLICSALFASLAGPGSWLRTAFNCCSMRALAASSSCSWRMASWVRVPGRWRFRWRAATREPQRPRRRGSCGRNRWIER